MKLTLYMAITVNGYIADKNENTNWVCDTDWAQLEKYIAANDAVIMGRKTKDLSGDDYPY
jgi:dihydrofolate reductase